MLAYAEFLDVSEDGLTVVGEDYEKKRYKRYRQWSPEDRDCSRGLAAMKQSFHLRM
jgi:hypothetical protein